MLKQEFKTIEMDIGTIADMEVRGTNKQDKIKQIISLLKQIQKERDITDMSKDFLRNILLDFSNVSDRTRRRLLNEILDNAKNKKERVRTKKMLVKKIPFYRSHQEKRLKGEFGNVKSYGLDIVWENRNTIEMYYSFL